MANWVEPKSNYVATDQVTPDIFNTLAENEKFLYEIRCPMEVQDSEGNVTKINSLVFVETTTDGVYKAKYKKSDGTLVEIPIEASQSVKLKSSRSIGINGLDAESASFNGTSAVKIKVTGVPAELLYGTASIDITGNAATANEAQHANSADEATNADYATNAGTAQEAIITQKNLNTLESQLRSGGTIVGHAELADEATNADYATSAGSASTAISATSATTATTLKSSWTAYTPGTTYLSYGTYMFLTIIDDQSSQSGGHGASFTDIITVNSDVYKGLAPDNTYHNDYANGPIHIYDANSHESPWFRTARLKIFGISSSQFRMDLYVSSSGGYALSTTDINGAQFYPNTLARSITGITYKMYYKKIM